MHRPAAHESVVQVLPSLQVAQAPPALPQWVAVAPPWQVEPVTHPVQQLPPTHLPPEQAVPSAAEECWHAPLTHVSTVQGSPSSQLWQAAPAAPHAEAAVPDWQDDPFQHPAQHAPP